MQFVTNGGGEQIEFKDIGCRYAPIKGFKDYYITECGDVYSTRKRGKEINPHLHKLKPKTPEETINISTLSYARTTGRLQSQFIDLSRNILLKVILTGLLSTIRMGIIEIIITQI